MKEAELSLIEGVDDRTNRLIGHAVTALRWLPQNLYHFNTSMHTSDEIVKTLAMFGVLAVPVPTQMLPMKLQRKIKRPHWMFYKSTTSRAAIVRHLRATVKLNGGEWEKGYKVEIPKS